MTTELTVTQLHIRVDGRSFDVPLSELDVGDISTDQEIRIAVSNWLSGVFGYEVPVAKLNAFAIDRTINGITLRPEAVFGS